MLINGQEDIDLWDEYCILPKEVKQFGNTKKFNIWNEVVERK